MNQENTQGNPNEVDDAVFGSEADSFFEQLESDVNGGIQDNGTQNVQNEETPVQQDPTKVEQQVSEVSQENSEIDNLKKRYSDSSREAQRLKAQLNELQPFMPVLDAMKNDGNLVSHVRNYFEDGGNVPKDIKSELKLDENFEFDPDEMVNNESSDSRKVFDSMVNNIVNKRADEIVSGIQQENYQKEHSEKVNSQAADFMKKNGMTGDEFNAFVNEAQDRFKTKGMSFDDMYLIMNQGKVSQNVANATKEDMLNQMKNVRNIPASQSAANSKSVSNNPTDGVFDVLKDLDGGLDDMFG